LLQDDAACRPAMVTEILGIFGAIRKFALRGDAFFQNGCMIARPFQIHAFR
jgi:hypothetical protein